MDISATPFFCNTFFSWIEICVRGYDISHRIFLQVFQKKTVQTEDQQLWIVKRLVYAWSLPKKKQTPWPGKALSAHVMQMMHAYELLGNMIEDWRTFDGRQQATTANNYLVHAAAEWFHPNYNASTHDGLVDLGKMITSFVSPAPVPVPENVQSEALDDVPLVELKSMELEVTAAVVPKDENKQAVELIHQALEVPLSIRVYILFIRVILGAPSRVCVSLDGG